MTNANDARKAHKLLDYVSQGRAVLDEEIELLRKFLPERPKDVTLDDLLTRVHDAWIKANPSDWGFDTPAEHHDWLFDLRNDLVRILQEQDTPAAAVAALPDGMRLADHEELGRVVVSPRPDTYLLWEVSFAENNTVTGAELAYVGADTLTFLDTEPAEPAHPEFLETEADYQKAPEGTIVVADGGVPCHKFQSTWSSVAFLAMKDDRGMSRARRRVLRWGNE